MLPALEEVLAYRDDVDVVFAGHATGPIAAELRDRALAGLGDPWLPEDRTAWPERILRELDRPHLHPDQLRAAGRRLNPQRRLDPVIAVYRELVP